MALKNPREPNQLISLDMTPDKTAIRDAATVIVLRDRWTNPTILMGQRGSKAAFMPNKFVFPGGAVDAADATIPLAAPLPEVCTDRLLEDADPTLAHALSAEVNLGTHSIHTGGQLDTPLQRPVSPR